MDIIINNKKLCNTLMQTIPPLPHGVESTGPGWESPPYKLPRTRRYREVMRYLKIASKTICARLGVHSHALQCGDNPIDILNALLYWTLKGQTSGSAYLLLPTRLSALSPYQIRLITAHPVTQVFKIGYSAELTDAEGKPAVLR